MGGVARAVRSGRRRRVETDFNECSRCTVGVGEGPLGLQFLAVDSPVGGCGVQIDCSDSIVGKARQLTRIGDAIVIAVLPHKELAKVRIGAVHYAVSVGVQARQRREAAGVVSAGKVGREKLGAIFDRARTIHIVREEAIVACGPCDLIFGAVAVDVEGGAIGYRCKRNARRAQIENNGVNSGADERVEITD